MAGKSADVLAQIDVLLALADSQNSRYEQFCFDGLFPPGDCDEQFADLWVNGEPEAVFEDQFRSTQSDYLRYPKISDVARLEHETERRLRENEVGNRNFDKRFEADALSAEAFFTEGYDAREEPPQACTFDPYLL